MTTVTVDVLLITEDGDDYVITEDGDYYVLLEQGEAVTAHHVLDACWRETGLAGTKGSPALAGTGASALGLDGEWRYG